MICCAPFYLGELRANLTMSKQDVNVKSKQETAVAVTDKAQEAAAKIHKIYEPQWNSRADVLKTIISLSSASIVLSVTFSSSLRDLKVAPFWRYPLIFSFS